MDSHATEISAQEREMIILDHIRLYIKNTRRSPIPDGFQPSVSEIVALAHMSKREDIIETFMLAFYFGCAKGMRLMRKERKKPAYRKAKQDALT